MNDARAAIEEKLSQARPNGHDPAPLREWPILDDAAYFGLAGEAVGSIGPHSEADPVAILVQYLVTAGNAIGRGPYYQVEGDRHHTNLFANLVGNTSKGRKGTSWSRVNQVMTVADPIWADRRIHSGLSSGEGVIWAVRDPIMGTERQGNETVEVLKDPGVDDKRLMVVEPEYERVLAVMGRDGNTLSSIIRDAWDRGNLSSLTKNSPAKATGAHISVVGHITTDELRTTLDRVSMANGSANRCLWLMVRRARILPFGGALDEERVVELGRKTQTAIMAASRIGRVEMTSWAREEWRQVYPELSEGKPGLLGAITGRAEAQAMRIALIYALLDGRPEIDIEHLRAALAIVKYVEDSAAYIWGDMVGDPVADEILRALRAKRPEGMARSQINDLFSRHRHNGIGQALANLAQYGKATVRSIPTAGRPTEMWTAT